MPGARRGVVAFVGDIEQLRPGHWVSVGRNMSDDVGLQFMIFSRRYSRYPHSSLILFFLSFSLLLELRCSSCRAIIRKIFRPSLSHFSIFSLVFFLPNSHPDDNRNLSVIPTLFLSLVPCSPSLSALFLGSLSLSYFSTSPFIIFFSLSHFLSLPNSVSHYFSLSLS